MSNRTGVWLVGAAGGVASTTILGALAIRAGLRPPIGLVTESDLCQGVALPHLNDLVFGGCEISGQSLVDAALETIRENHALSESELSSLEPELQTIDNGITPGILFQSGQAIEGIAGDIARSGSSPKKLLGAIEGDIKAFREANSLDRVIVVNLASTEPANASPLQSLDFLEGTPESDPSGVRASTLYALAAARTGSPYINFTPSPALPSVVAREFEERGVVFAGSDGKTGETLVKAVLAPLFRFRQLQLLSWQGYNMLGDRDGLILDNPENKQSKVQTKDRILPEFLGYTPHTQVEIDYVPSLGDQKTAMDFVHFAGFMGVKMQLQFTWQGFDSILAAPLVLDLVRLAVSAQQAGHSGCLDFLSMFFKSPAGPDSPLDFASQTQDFLKGIEAIRQG